MSTVKSFVYYNKILYKYLVGREGQTIDKKSFMKNIWMEAEGEKTMITEYKSLCSVVLNKDYLENRLKYRAYIIYTNFITSPFPTKFDLHEFDNWLKYNAPKLKKYCDEIKVDAPKIGVHCPIVKLWRQGKLKYSASYTIYNLYCKIRNIIKKGKTNTIFFDESK